MKYQYDTARVTEYIDRQKQKKRITFAIAINYTFESLGVKTLFADAIISNKRSQHVLEKVGFVETGKDDMFVYYKIVNE